MNWYLKVVRDNYSNFNGRARREEYWMFTLFHYIIICALAIIGGLAFAATDSVFLMAILIFGYVLATFIPSLAVTVRRLHDIGKSGWFFLIQFIPYVGGIIMLVFTVKNGDTGSNEYGPDPKAEYIEQIDDIEKPQTGA